jgi:hypothetical protein
LVPPRTPAAAKKARTSADQSKAQLAALTQQLEAAQAQHAQAAAQLVALQAEKQRLLQRIAALEAELRKAREEAAAAAAAARRGPAARQQGAAKVAEIQDKARTALHQELSKTLQKRKLPEQVPLSPATAATPAAAPQPEPSSPELAASPEAAQPAKRSRVTPPEPKPLAAAVPEPVGQQGAEAAAQAAPADVAGTAVGEGEEEDQGGEEMEQVGHGRVA